MTQFIIIIIKYQMRWMCKTIICRVDSEYQVFCATMNWVNHDISNRRRSVRRKIEYLGVKSDKLVYVSCLFGKKWSKPLLFNRFVFHLQVYIWCVETCAFALGGHKTPGELRKQLHRHLVKGVFFLLKSTFLDQNSLELRRWPCPVWRKTWWVKRGVWCRSMWNQGKGGISSNVQMTLR